MNNVTCDYQAYLLRLWRVQCQGKWQWRASLQSPHTGERQVFSTLDELLLYLKSSHTSPEYWAETSPLQIPLALHLEEPEPPNQPKIEPSSSNNP